MIQKIQKIITLLVGIACVVIGIFVMITHFKNQQEQTAVTTAEIVRIDSEVEIDSDGFDTRYYYPVVKYKVDGKTYENRLPDSGESNSTVYREGDEIEIAYNPEDPNSLSKKGSIGGLIGGIVFVLFGIVSLIFSFKNIFVNRH